MAKSRYLRYAFLALLPATALVATYLSNNPDRSFHPREISARSTADENGISMIHTAIRRHKTDRTLDVVDFVVIERLSAPQEIRSLVHTRHWSSDHDPTAVLELPEGVIDLPSDQQLLQLSDGVFTAADARVEPSVLNDFLSSYSSASTIEQLIAMSNQKSGLE